MLCGSSGVALGCTVQGARCRVHGAGCRGSGDGRRACTRVYRVQEIVPRLAGHRLSVDVGTLCSPWIAHPPGTGSRMWVWCGVWEGAGRARSVQSSELWERATGPLLGPAKPLVQRVTCAGVALRRSVVVQFAPQTRCSHVRVNIHQVAVKHIVKYKQSAQGSLYSVTATIRTITHALMWSVRSCMHVVHGACRATSTCQFMQLHRAR